jgi:hypothetical protein
MFPVSIRQEIEAAESKQALVLIAKRMQLRKVPAGVSIDVLRQVLLNTAGDRDVHAEELCICGDLKRQHFINNETGEAFECKRPSCGCTRFKDALR